MPRILIVDDDDMVCDVLSRLVARFGHEADTAKRLREALRLAGTQDYDLVFLDLELPDGNGLKVLPDLLGAASKPEVIIVTGTGDVSGGGVGL